MRRWAQNAFPFLEQSARERIARHAVPTLDGPMLTYHAGDFFFAELRPPGRFTFHAWLPI
jgi:hypothetical protein